MKVSREMRGRNTGARNEKRPKARQSRRRAISPGIPIHEEKEECLARFIMGMGKGVPAGGPATGEENRTSIKEKG